MWQHILLKVVLVLKLAVWLYICLAIRSIGDDNTSCRCCIRPAGCSGRQAVVQCIALGYTKKIIQDIFYLDAKFPMHAWIKYFLCMDKIFPKKFCIQYKVVHVQCAVCSVQCAVCMCAVCTVQCAYSTKSALCTIQH